MANLNEDSNIKDLENFLLFHMDNATSEKAKINPRLTKEQVWNINIGAVMRGDIVRVENIMIKNLKREFGSYYE